MLLRRNLATSAIAVAIICALGADGFCAEKIKTLMVRNGGHDFNGFKAVFAEVLDKTGDFDVAVAENFDALKAENLKGFDLVFFYGSGGNLADPAQEKGLDEFVKNGGGMAGVHATDAHKKSDIYWHLIGGRFTGHGGGKFKIFITDKKHPITDGMEDFEISDETYRNKYHPDAKIESLGKMDRGKEQQSMVWVQKIGKGRVFNTTLGHGKAAFDNPHLQRLVVRGLYWAVGQKPKDP